jgi:hypothetical protein
VVVGPLGVVVVVVGATVVVVAGGAVVVVGGTVVDGGDVSDVVPLGVVVDVGDDDVVSVGFVGVVSLASANADVAGVPTSSIAAVMRTSARRAPFPRRFGRAPRARVETRVRPVEDPPM